MCGICGFTGNKNDTMMQDMLNKMRHRGPDDTGCYSDENINLGMVRLAIIDIKRGGQPQLNEKNSLVVIFNGEIYNYVELKKELELKGHFFKTSSDTETIVHAYEEYGYDFPHKLNGMFAIALWNVLKKELILIRDRFGVKPLFYTLKGSSLIFGSEIKTLLVHLSISREIDYEALAHYFSLRNVPAPFTVYKDIKVLLPGHMLIWDGRKSEIVRWYDLLKSASCEETNEDRLVDKIDELLNDSVKLRLRSDVNYGAYLSGGIDSSTIVALMSRHSSTPVKTFSLAYADTPPHKVDVYYARKVAEQFSTEHHEYVMSWSELRRDLPEVIRHLDQPFAGVIASYWLSGFMRHYVTVALSGDGADDFFASYGHHRLVWPIAEVQKAFSECGSLDNVDFGFFTENKDFVLKLANLKPWEWRLAYAAFMDSEREMLFSKIGQEFFMPYSTPLFLRDIYEQSNRHIDDLNKMLYLDINTLLLNEILYFNDMLSMVHSMEVRTPFLDFRLAELAFSIPGRLKIRNRALKYILRRVASRYIPNEIIERPKEGFVLPKNTWLKSGLLPLLKDVLSAERLAIHGYFNGEYVDSLIQRFLNGDDALTFKIWTLMVFQIWYENYIKENA